MKIFYSIIIITILIFGYFLLDINAGNRSSFNLIGTKYSDIQNDMGDNYTKTETARDRTTYSFFRENNNLIQFAVKNDIIEVIEIYNVFNGPDDAFNLYTELVLYTSVVDDCKLLRAYNTTMEFTKNNIIIRIEQIPTQYGWMVKYTALVNDK